MSELNDAPHRCSGSKASAQHSAFSTLVSFAVSALGNPSRDWGLLRKNICLNLSFFSLWSLKKTTMVFSLVISFSGHIKFASSCALSGAWTLPNSRRYLIFLCMRSWRQGLWEDTGIHRQRSQPLVPYQPVSEQPDHILFPEFFRDSVMTQAGLIDMGSLLPALMEHPIEFWGFWKKP